MHRRSAVPEQFQSTPSDGTLTLRERLSECFSTTAPELGAFRNRGVRNPNGDGARLVMGCWRRTSLCAMLLSDGVTLLPSRQYRT